MQNDDYEYAGVCKSPKFWNIPAQVKADASIPSAECPWPLAPNKVTASPAHASLSQGFIAFFQHHIDAGSDPDTIDVQTVVQQQTHGVKNG